MQQNKLVKTFMALSYTLFLILLAACNSPASTGGQTGKSASASTSKAITSNTMPMPPTQTSCPNPGTARAAVTANLALGHNANIVYAANGYTSMLKRYDVITRQKTTILTVQNGALENAQVSPDGQWILFTLLVDGSPSPLELVRLDGQGQQTLYCGQIEDAQWSPNQKYIAFSETHSMLTRVELLNLGTGTIQTELTNPDNTAQGLYVKTWLDNTHIYLRGGDNKRISVLDMSKGTNQNSGLLPIVSTQSFQDFDSSFDGSRLYIVVDTNSQSYNSGTYVVYQAPATITVQPALGKLVQTFLNDTQNSITNIRAITKNTLLLIRSYALWKVNTNGTGLTLLAKDQVMHAELNPSSQFPWSNISRDNRMFAVEQTEQGVGGTITQSMLEYGSLVNGNPQTFATSDGTLQLVIAGWTTL